MTSTGKHEMIAWNDYNMGMDGLVTAIKTGSPETITLKLAVVLERSAKIPGREKLSTQEHYEEIAFSLKRNRGIDFNPTDFEPEKQLKESTSTEIETPSKTLPALSLELVAKIETWIRSAYQHRIHYDEMMELAQKEGIPDWLIAHQARLIMKKLGFSRSQIEYRSRVLNAKQEESTGKKPEIQVFAHKKQLEQSEHQDEEEPLPHRDLSQAAEFYNKNGNMQKILEELAAFKESEPDKQRKLKELEQLKKNPNDLVETLRIRDEKIKELEKAVLAQTFHQADLKLTDNERVEFAQLREKHKQALEQLEAYGHLDHVTPQEGGFIEWDLSASGVLASIMRNQGKTIKLKHDGSKVLEVINE